MDWIGCASPASNNVKCSTETAEETGFERRCSQQSQKVHSRNCGLPPPKIEFQSPSKRSAGSAALKTENVEPPNREFFEGASSCGVQSEYTAYFER